MVQPSTPNVNRERSRLQRRCDAISSDVETAEALMRSQPTDDVAENEQRKRKAIESIEIIRAHVESMELIVARLGQEAANAEVILKEPIDISDDIKNAEDVFVLVDIAKGKLNAFIRSLPTAATTSHVESVPSPDHLNRLLTVIESQANQTNSHAQSRSFKLPKLDLGKFDGDVFKWKPFWDMFQSAIDSNETLSAVEKLQYLKSAIEGEPSKIIANLNLTEENYPIAVNLLKIHFADPAKIITKVRATLLHLQPVPFKTAELKQFVLNIEGAIQSLEAMGETIDSKHYVEIVMSKLPRQMIVQLQLTKGPEPWTLPVLRERLRAAVEAEESADTFASATRPSTSQESYSTADALFVQQQNTQQRGPKRPKTANPEPRHDRAAQGQNSRAVQNQGQRPNSNPNQGQRSNANQNLPHMRPQQPSSNCVFCDNRHWNADCQAYPTASERKRRMRGRCYVCLREGHNAFRCTRRKQCRSCGSDQHAYALCNRAFPPRQQAGQTTAALAQDANAAGPGPNIPQTQSNQVPTTSQSSPNPRDSNLLTNACTETELQTALTDASGPLTTQQVRVVFDTGSNRSYVTDDLAAALGLSVRDGFTLEINRFADSAPVEIRTKVSVIRLACNDGTQIQIPVCVIPRITNSITRMPLRDTNAIVKAAAGLPLADRLPATVERVPVQLLIGNDFYCDLITGQRVQVSDGLYLLHSRFGLILSGRTVKKAPPQTQTAMMCFQQPVREHISLAAHVESPSIEALWDLESIGITDNPNISDDAIAQKQFHDTVQLIDSRYCVQWPWKSNSELLPTGFHLAKNRLQSQAEKFRRNPVLLDECDAIIQNKLNLGVIEEVPNDPPMGKTHYLPHHPVIRADSATTKVRMVFDASARSRKDAPSVNDCLYRGPVRLENLAGLLLRFRLHPTAVVADIEKAFWQVGLHEADRDVTRFLWWKDKNNLDVRDNLRVFRFTRVPFGFTSSPFLLEETLHLHTNKYKTTNSQKLRKDLYVDNIITGVESLSEAQSFYTETKAILADAKMNLREWASNDPAVMAAIPLHDRVAENVVKILGMPWDREKDTLKIPKIDMPCTQKITKRTILSLFARIYDPLGLVNPISIRARVLFQAACKQHPKWDAPLNPDLVAQFEDLSGDVAAIENVTVPRFQGTVGKIEHLHCFCDASEQAYAAAVYAVFQTDGHRAPHLLFSKCRVKPRQSLTMPRMELIAALIGCRMTTFVRTQIEYTGPVTLWSDSQCVLCWIDSAKVTETFVENRLKHIRKHKTEFQFRYVASEDNPADLATRVQISPQLSDLWWTGPKWLSQPESSWPKWSPGTRTAATVAAAAPSPVECSAIASESQTVPPEPPFGIDITKFSDYTKLLRLTATCYRYIQNLRPKHRAGRGILQSDIRKSALKWIQFAQATDLHVVMKSVLDSKRVPNDRGKELQVMLNTPSLTTSQPTGEQSQVMLKTAPIKSIQRQELQVMLNTPAENNIAQTELATDLRVVSKSVGPAEHVHRKNSDESAAAIQVMLSSARRPHNVIRQLGVALDNHGILRCYGRMSNISAAEHTRNPILLPRKHPLTKLIVKHHHEKMGHVGAAQVLANLRLNFWILSGRRTVRSVQLACKQCQKMDSPPYRLPPMPQLPASRVTKCNPFTHTGLDYFGPLYIATTDGKQKVWVALFTCLTVRAIHLELVTDLSAEKFLLSFRRFIAAHGAPQTIICDNAPQFKAVAQAQDDLWSEAIRSYPVQDQAINLGIRWSYTTPYGPWTGGVFERMVQVAKRVLRKVLGKSKLTAEQLETVLKEVQHIVNTRPLTYVEESPDQMRVLRPIDFLAPLSSGGGPVGQNLSFDIADVDYIPTGTTRNDLLQLWKKSQNMLEQFWKQWSSEYLLSLREKHSFQHPTPRSTAEDVPVPGTVVLVREALQPRSRWAIARIEAVVKSPDGAIRSAMIKTPDGKVLQRPINLLYPLEQPENEHLKKRENEQSTQLEGEQRVNSATPAARNTRPRRAAFNRAAERIKVAASSETDDDRSPPRNVARSQRC